jgi:hypothetical protein
MRRESWGVGWTGQFLFVMAIGIPKERKFMGLSHVFIRYGMWDFFFSTSEVSG